MADKKISELDLALRINNDAVFPMSQDNAGEPTTFKVGITQLGTEIAEDMTFSNLQTASKKLVGAINELLSLGSPIIIGTTAPTSSQGANGNIYVQYTEGTGGADDEVDGIYVKIDGAWCEISTGGGSGAGGHTIVDNAGTSLPQRTNLQFKGAYSEDNATDNTTEIDVVREMTKAEFDELTEAEKTGLINITDITGGNDDRFQPVIYSEEEREIGVWVDGKPLYQKTFVLSQGIYLAQYQWVDTGCYLPNAEQIIASDLGADVSGISGVMDIHTSENYSLYAMNMRNTTVQLSKFTVQYTKSTDTAGSGQWTPQGVPAHHYSENEQVVGTWIDGSTVYEKSYYLDNIAYTTANTYKELFSISSFGKLISLVGALSNSAKTNFRNLPLTSGGDLNKQSMLFFESAANHGNANSVFFVSQDTWVTAEIFVTIRYTKSST